MKKWSIWVVLAFGFFSLQTSAGTLNQDLQHKLDHFRRANAVPGVVMSVSLPNEMGLRDFTSGVDRVPQGKPVTTDHLFQIGSITKSFTAALILKLEAEHLISLSDTVGDYLPQYPKWRAITIRQLLNHTSGIYDYTLDSKLDHIKNPRYRSTSWSLADLANIAYKRRLQFQPGHSWHYSNTNYIIIGMIIEKITHQSMAQNIQNLILNPKMYGLSSTHYISSAYPTAVLSRMAHGYYRNGGQDETYVNLSWAGSAGAIVSNSHDLIKWSRALFHGKVLPQQQLREMTTVTSRQTGRMVASWSHEKGYGLGVGRKYIPGVGDIWFHPGGTTGFSALFMWSQQNDVVVAITANSHDVNIRKINAFGASVLQAVMQHQKEWRGRWGYGA
jgi:D-alanyl-D-alanine carboxypeptidase